MEVRTRAGAKKGPGLTGRAAAHGSAVLTLQDARAHTRTHALPLRTQHRQAGTDLHPAGITEERFQVSLTELLACKQSSGAPGPTTPTATSIPGEPQLNRKNPAVCAGGRLVHPQPSPTAQGREAPIS